METVRFTARQLKLGIIAAIPASGAPQMHRSSLLGLPYSRGFLEIQLQTTFNQAERQLAADAVDDLLRRDLLERTFTDANNVDAYVRLATHATRAASTGLLDELDAALSGVRSDLPDLREGAWLTLRGGRPDSVRQAAHSGRELVEHLLRTAAPDADVVAQPGFVRDAEAGVTRRHRVEHLARTRGAHTDDPLIGSAVDSLLAAHRRLTAISHAPATFEPPSVEVQLKSLEDALRTILACFARPPTP